MAKKKVLTFSWDHFMERLRNSVFRPKRQVKDIVFRLIFGNNKEALLQLYNALNKTKYMQNSWRSPENMPFYMMTVKKQ